jgi:hypothetical protein
LGLVYAGMKVRVTWSTNGESWKFNIGNGESRVIDSCEYKIVLPIFVGFDCPGINLEKKLYIAIINYKNLIILSQPRKQNVPSLRTYEGYLIFCYKLSTYFNIFVS